MATALITRPQDDDKMLEHGLTEKGWNILHTPLLTRRLSQNGIKDAQNYSYIIISSPSSIQNRIKGFTGSFHVVGKRTADALTRAGHMENIFTYPTMADLLANLPCDTDERVLYLRGEYVKQEIKPLIRNLDEQIMYTTDAAKNLPPETVRAFEKQEIGLVTLLSPRTAGVFMSLIGEYNFALPRFLCMSEDIAANLPHTAEKIIAVQPDLAGLLAVCPMPNT